MFKKLNPTFNIFLEILCVLATIFYLFSSIISFNNNLNISFLSNTVNNQIDQIEIIIILLNLTILFSSIFGLIKIISRSIVGYILNIYSVFIYLALFISSNYIPKQIADFLPVGFISNYTTFLDTLGISIIIMGVAMIVFMILGIIINLKFLKLFSKSDSLILTILIVFSIVSFGYLSYILSNVNLNIVPPYPF